jgi:hypothetical protein
LQTDGCLCEFGKELHNISGRPKSTNKSIFTKHKMRVGKVEEEKEEAETRA